MKLFLFKSIILATIITISTIGTKYFLHFLPFEKNYLSAMVDKLEMLKKYKDKQKILLIGGSSVGFGLSADQIQKATNITTINLGHSAGIGLLDYQEFIITCLKPNDIIIFSPEWVFYENPDYYNPAVLGNLYKNSTYFKIITKKSFTKVKSVLMSKIFSMRKISILTKNIIDTSNVYIYNCCNINGDIISHCGLNPSVPIKYKVDFAHFDLELFKTKFKYTTKAKCILLFPPTQKLVYAMHKKSFDNLQITISKSHLDYVDLITSNIYNETDFFDSAYHLRCEIKNKRTEKVIKYIINSITSSKSNQTHQGSN